MATTIRVVCYDCGDVALLRNQVLRICANKPGCNTYEFTCPQCSQPTSRSADQATTQALRGGGCPIQIWKIPAEAFERHTGPPISRDDILDLILDLHIAESQNLPLA